MRTNTIFTYALYAALALLISVAGYKACQMKSAQSAKAEEEAALEQRLQELGYVNPDTTQEESSAYVGDDKSGSEETPASSPSGIEYSDPTPVTSEPAPVSKPAVKQQPAPTQSTTTTAQKPAASKPATTSKPAPVIEDPKPQSPAPSPKPAATVASGKYLVVTGSFSVMDNARDEMETLIKMGYVNAEVRKFKPSFATVIALRTNDRKKADAEAAKLKSKGYSGTYVRTQ
jgi:cell division septation protein DedD